MFYQVDFVVSNYGCKKPSTNSLEVTLDIPCLSTPKLNLLFDPYIYNSFLRVAHKSPSKIYSIADVKSKNVESKKVVGSNSLLAYVQDSLWGLFREMFPVHENTPKENSNEQPIHVGDNYTKKKVMKYAWVIYAVNEAYLRAALIFIYKFVAIKTKYPILLITRNDTEYYFSNVYETAFRRLNITVVILKSTPFSLFEFATNGVKENHKVFIFPVITSTPCSLCPPHLLRVF